MKTFKLIVLSLLAGIVFVYAQNPYGINILYRNDGFVSIASSTNNPTLVTTNLANRTAPMIRCSFSIQNTNATAINVYSDVNGSNIVRVVGSNEIFSIVWPIADTTQYYLRHSDTTSVSVIRSETWGR